VAPPSPPRAHAISAPGYTACTPPQITTNLSPWNTANRLSPLLPAPSPVPAPSSLSPRPICDARIPHLKTLFLCLSLSPPLSHALSLARARSLSRALSRALSLRGRNCVLLALEVQPQPTALESDAHPRNACGLRLRFSLSHTLNLSLSLSLSYSLTFSLARARALSLSPSLSCDAPGHRASHSKGWGSVQAGVKL
jgi:hypothetical protein